LQLTEVDRLGCRARHWRWRRRRGRAAIGKRICDVELVVLRVNGTRLRVIFGLGPELRQISLFGFERLTTHARKLGLNGAKGLLAVLGALRPMLLIRELLRTLLAVHLELMIDAGQLIVV
jgi:hypothetical protein